MLGLPPFSYTGDWASIYHGGAPIVYDFEW